MEISGQFHAPAALSPKKLAPILRLFQVDPLIQDDCCCKTWLQSQ
jgi:hypothetical protein